MKCSDALGTRGYAIVPGVLAPREVSTVARAIERASIPGAGSRNLLARSWCRALVQRVRQRLVSDGVLAPPSVAVQCTLFDKTASRNWLVALHQDVSIPVRARVDHPALGAWSRKEGVCFVQPPVEVLEQLVAVRLHIDDCGVENGPLKVVPGSHRAGRLSPSAATVLRGNLGEEACLAQRGDAVVMRPLLLHASSKAQAPSRRRVLHLLFGPKALPHGLEWMHPA